MPVKKEISLLPDEDNVNSFSARAIRWLTSVGRYVIVFTELFVICAFISRFWLDRTNSDLSEVVRQQTAILNSTADFEKDYAALQRRLNLIKTVYASQPQFKSKVESIAQSTPLDITFQNFVVSRNPKTNEISSSLIFYAYKETSVIDFITNLILNPDVASVNIVTIDKKPRDNKYNVALSLAFTNKTTK